jgi:hypothetical protein
LDKTRLRVLVDETGSIIEAFPPASVKIDDLGPQIGMVAPVSQRLCDVSIPEELSDQSVLLDDFYVSLEGAEPQLLRRPGSETT